VKFIVVEGRRASAIGIPRNVNDLDKHDLICFGAGLPSPVSNIDWILKIGKEGTKRRPKFRVNCIYAMSLAIEKGGGGLGFELSGDSVEDSQYNRIKSLVNEELKQYFRPEFLNRLDEIIVFRQLTKNEVKEIAEIMLQEVFVRLQDKGITLNVTDAFKERLVEEGYNPSYGARPLRRAVMRLLEDSLAEEVLSGRIKDGDNALVDIDDNKKVTINISSEESSQELAGANF